MIEEEEIIDAAGAPVGAAPPFLPCGRFSDRRAAAAQRAACSPPANILLIHPRPCLNLAPPSLSQAKEAPATDAFEAPRGAFYQHDDRGGEQEVDEAENEVRARAGDRCCAPGGERWAVACCESATALLSAGREEPHGCQAQRQARVGHDRRR